MKLTLGSKLRGGDIQSIIGVINDLELALNRWFSRPDLPVVLTANLPTAANARAGLILIEDAGAGAKNLIIYAGGERHRINGGANV